MADRPPLPSKKVAAPARPPRKIASVTWVYKQPGNKRHGCWRSEAFELVETGSATWEPVAEPKAAKPKAS